MVDATPSPAPWFYQWRQDEERCCSDGTCIVTAKDGRVVADDIRYEDVRLILAAPDLLAACTAALAFINSAPFIPGEGVVSDQLAAAIALTKEPWVDGDEIGAAREAAIEQTAADHVSRALAQEPRP